MTIKEVYKIAYRQARNERNTNADMQVNGYELIEAVHAMGGNLSDMYRIEKKAKISLRNRS